ARARTLLRGRLERRGVVATAAPVLMCAGDAAVSPGLIDVTLSYTHILLAGRGGASGVPPAVTALMKGASYTMLLHSRRVLAAVLAIAAAALTGTIVGARQDTGAIKPAAEAR